MRGVQPCSFCQLHTWFLTLKVQKLQEVECTCLILPLPTVVGWCDRFRGVLLTQEVLCPPRSEGPRSPSPAWGGEAGKCEFTFSDLWMHVLTGWASEIRSVLPPRPWSARDWFAEDAYFYKKAKDKELGGFFSSSTPEKPYTRPFSFRREYYGYHSTNEMCSAAGRAVAVRTRGCCCHP